MYDINVVAWTLGLEILLYLAITLAFATGILSKTWVLSLSILSILGGASIIFPTVLHIRFPAGAMAVFAAIIAGIVLYRWFSDQLSLRVTAIILTLCFVATAISSVVNYPRYHQAGIGTQPNQFCAIFSAFSAYAFFIGMMKFRNCRLPSWIFWLGTVSYSLYLLHPSAAIKVNPGDNPFYRDGLVLIRALVLAWFGYTFVEVPSAKLSKKVLSKL